MPVSEFEFFVVSFMSILGISDLVSGETHEKVGVAAVLVV